MEDLRSLVLVKTEDTYGTVPTPEPDASANAIITLGQPTFEVTTKQLERNVPLAHFGQVAPTVIGESLKLNFQVELKGSPTAGAAPVIAPLFKCANFTETPLTMPDRIQYTLNSTYEGSSATFYFYVSGSLHKITGAVCNLKIPLQAGERVVMDVEATGLYSGPDIPTENEAFPNALFSNIPPLVWESAAFKIDGSNSYVCNKLNVDLGNEISKRTDVNAASGISRYFVKNRNVKSDFQIEKVKLSTFNPWDKHKTQASIDLVTDVTSGSAGNKIKIEVNDLYLDPPKYAELEEVRMWDLAGTARPSLTQGDQEVKITFS